MGFIPKPFESDEFLGTIGRVLGEKTDEKPKDQAVHPKIPLLPSCVPCRSILSGMKWGKHSPGG